MGHMSVWIDGERSPKHLPRVLIKGVAIEFPSEHSPAASRKVIYGDNVCLA